MAPRDFREQLLVAATRMGGDPAVASTFLAEYLPKIVDKLIRPEKSILPRTINKNWLLCSRPYCRVLPANHPATSPLKGKGCPFFSSLLPSQALGLRRVGVGEGGGCGLLKRGGTT